MSQLKTNRATEWVNQNMRVLSMVVGSIVMALWAMVRFFSKPTNFDQVGQQVLTHQWLSGIHDGAVIGPTNYLLKMLFLYMPFDLIAISPRLKLITMTLLVNTVAYICIVIVLEKIWQEFEPKIPKTFYAATVWFALAAGSIFWIQFANSRNLEVAGGLLLVWLIIRLRKTHSVPSYMVLGLFSALLFFADPLQLYMSAIPAVIFLLCDGIIAKYHFKNRLILAARTIGALGIGFILAKCMTWFVQKLFGIEFIVATNQRGGTSIITIISDSIVPAAKQAARLYVGGYELGRYVEALNLLFVAVIVVAAVWYVLRKNISRSLCSLIALVILVNMSIYIASGQALQGGTSRYLIMTVPFFVLLIALVTGTVTKAQKLLIGATLLLLVTNTLALFGAVYYNWNPTFSRDAHTGEAISYMKRSNYTYGYASMDTALSSNYLSGYSAQLLPIKCEPNNTVESAFLFFDKANYKQSVSVNQAEVPLILDNEQIGNYPSVCSIDTIKSCLGSWEKAERLSDGSLVLIYNAAQVRTALGLTN